MDCDFSRCRHGYGCCHSSGSTFHHDHRAESVPSSPCENVILLEPGVDREPSNEQRRTGWMWKRLGEQGIQLLPYFRAGRIPIEDAIVNQPGTPPPTPADELNLSSVP